jgi:hypothetical protein
VKRLITATIIACFTMAAFGIVKADDAQYVASAKRAIYHCPECVRARAIAPDDRVEFKTAEEAISARCKPCKLCKPPIKTVAYVASKGSFTYHKPDCSIACKIYRGKLVTFPTEQAAIDAGFSPCMLCCKKEE